MSPKQIIALRKRLKLTQEKLGQLVGAHQVTVARWETGVNQPEGAYLKGLRELADRARKKKRGGYHGAKV